VRRRAKAHAVLRLFDAQIRENAHPTRAATYTRTPIYTMARDETPQISRIQFNLSCYLNPHPEFCFVSLSLALVFLPATDKSFPGVTY